MTHIQQGLEGHLTGKYEQPPGLGFGWAMVCALAGFSLGWASVCSGAEEAALAAPVALSLHGFGTLGLTRGNQDSAEFVRDLSQPLGAGQQWSARVDSLLGVQANLLLGPHTEAVLQAVSRYHGNQTWQPELTWAFLRHELSPDVALRAGRLGTEFFMLGDSRLVGYSSLSVRPPPDFYGSLVFSYIDGVDASATLPAAQGLLKAKLFAGRSPEVSPFSPGIIWDHKGSRLTGGYLDYLKGPWQVRLSHTEVRFANETPTDALLRSNGDPLAGLPYLALVPEMAMANKKARFRSLGLVFEDGPLNVQLMFNKIRHQSPAYADAAAAYGLVAYRWDRLTPYMGVSRSRSDRETLPSGPVPAVDAITQSLVAQSYTDQTTYTLGTRWDWQKNLALKTQVDWVRGHPDSLFLFKATQPDWTGRMTVFSLALDFVF